MTRYLENILKIKVNRGKSKVVSAIDCLYLVYIAEAAGALRVGKEKVEKFKERIHEITRRNRSRRLRDKIEKRNA